MAGDFRFSYLLIKYRKVSGSDDTRNQLYLTVPWVRIPSSPPNKTDADRASVPLFLWWDSNGSALTEPAGESESLPLRQKTRLSRSKSRKDFLAAFVFENMEGGTYELFKL